MSTKPILCPICKKPVDPSNEDVPFCSDRCRVLDLGKWASGDYKVSSPVLDPELLEEVEQAQFNAERRREGRNED
jgi:endogenous inhibitor of DNA gyrase (YacG/DUF329 family)